MKKIFFLLPALFFVSFCAWTQDVSGLWTGRFTTTGILQDNLPYKYELLIFQNGDNLTGYSYSSAGAKDFYAVCEISGKLYEGYMVVTEKKTLYQNPPEPEGVMQSHILFFSSDNKEATGDWKQINKQAFQVMIQEGQTFLQKEEDPSKSGLIKVLEEKNRIAVTDKNSVAAVNADSVKLASREKEILQTIVIASDSVQIELYDDGLIDGDIISLYVNNNVLLDKIALKDKALKQTIPFNSGGESIFISMFAENEGTIPPNTGLLIIRDGQKKYEVRFKSDLKKSSAVELKRN
ncbi:MAG: hypothetical protein QM725_13855 [Lacibacter sp.]